MRSYPHFQRSTPHPLTILFFILIVTTSVVSAGSTVNWEIISGEYDDTRAFDIVQTDDGGYIIVGATIHPTEEGYQVPSPFYQAYIIRVTGTGEILFEKTIDDERTRTINAIIRAQDGTYVITGSISDPPDHDSDAYLARMDESGTIIWERAFGGEYYDTATDLVEIESGGFALVGVTTDPDPINHRDYYLVLTDDSGDPLFERSYGDRYTDMGNSIDTTSDGGFIIAGDGEFSLIRTDQSGTVLWNRSLREPSTADSGEVVTPNAVLETPDGDFILAGTTFSKDGDTITFHATLFKFNRNSEILWRKVYPGDGRSSFYSVKLMENGEITAVGETSRPDPSGNPLISGESSIFLIRADQFGDPIIQTSIRRGEYSSGKALLITGNEFIIAGSISEEREGYQENDPRRYLTRAFATSLSIDSNETSVKEQSVPLLYAPVLALPFFFFTRRRTKTRENNE